jgi:lambda family phage portal protein
MADRSVTFLDRAIAAVAPGYALQRAIARDRLTFFGYDAADTGNRRGSSGGMAKNAGSETAKMAQDRLKVMWDARDLERNMPVIRCVLDRTAQYVCGQILYQAGTGDAAIDSQYESYLNNWFATKADLTGRHNFRMLVELAFRSMLRDGDFAFNMVRDSEGVLRLQCIESDRIGDPAKVGSNPSETYVQGITIDANGMPTAYDVYRRERSSLRYVKEETVPADQFLFLSKPLRTDEYRGVSWLAPVLAQARDLYEMFSFERGASKWASSIAGVITLSDPMARGANGSAGMFDGVQTSGGPSQTIEGNKLLRLKPNESVTPFNTGTRPNGAFTAFIEASLRDIAMGLNVPYGFFNMAQFGGATVRLEAMQMQRTFARFQELLTSKILNRVKDAVLNDGIAKGELAPTQFWNAGRWQFGPHLTADTGYDTDANLSLLQNGLKSAAAIAGEEGLDYEDLVDQLVKEAAILRDKCAASGIPVEMVAQARFPEATAQLAAVQQAMVPKYAPSVDELGDGGVKALTDVLEKAAQGILPREEAIAYLIQVFGFDPRVAEQIVPEKQKEAVKANQPAAAGAKPAAKPAAKKPDAK